MPKADSPKRTLTMTNKSIHHSKEEYIVELSDNKRHGHGLCIYPDGGQYEGEWRNDKRHGPGTYLDPNGGSYEGQWKDGMEENRGQTPVFWVVSEYSSILDYNAKSSCKQLMVFSCAFFEMVPNFLMNLRTNCHFTLKKNPLKSADLDDFIRCYKPGKLAARKETERFRSFAYEELIKRDKLSLDIFWLKDDSLEDMDSLPAPDVMALKIVENLQAALEQFSTVADALGAGE
ncbi:MAG: hypothetical protein D3925_00680 [Candidatus Electrothrix sp. AR5]|nr:hypothetical protein [Candidatus Electrothrix sp. AR5]